MLIPVITMLYRRNAEGNAGMRGDNIMKNVNLLIISVIVFLLSLLPVCNIAFAVDERLDIVTYYPSTAGSYDTVDVFGTARVKDLILAPGAILGRGDPENPTTILDDNGFVFTNENVKFENDYFTPTLKAHTLRATNGLGYQLIWDRNIGGAFGIMSATLSHFTFGIDTSSSLTSLNPGSFLGSGSEMDCRDALVNNVYMLISASPSCFAGPPDIPLAVCWGQTKEMGYYSCLNPRSFE